MRRLRAIDYRMVLLVWVSLWLIFSVRGFILKDYEIFKNTLFKDTEAKRRYLMKEGLYDFTLFCRERIPEKDGFDFVCDWKTADPVERSRVMYYLFPRIMKENASYIMVFKSGGYKKPGFELMDRFGEDSFILRKTY